MTFLSWIFSAKVEIDNIIARISKVMICLSRLFMNDFITASEGSTSVYHAPPSIINTAAQRGGVLAASTKRWHDFLFGSTHALHSVMSCCKISAHHSQAVSSRGPTLPLTELTCANKASTRFDYQYMSAGATCANKGLIIARPSLRKRCWVAHVSRPASFWAQPAARCSLVMACTKVFSHLSAFSRLTVKLTPRLDVQTWSVHQRKTCP